MAKWNPKKFTRRGDVMHQISDIKHRIESNETSNSTRSTTISRGALRITEGANIEVDDGGHIVLQGGGNMNVRDGGSIVLAEDGSFSALYEKEHQTATFIGGGYDRTSGRPFTGVYVEHPNGTSYFNAYRYADTGKANVLIGRSNHRTDSFMVFSDSARMSADSPNEALWLDNQGGGGINLADGPVWIGHQTVGSGPQCTISPSGLISRVSSSIETKQDIEDVDIDTADVLSLRGRTWRDKSAVEADPDCEERHVGFIAEEVEAAGLDEFVIYDDDSKPVGILYDRLSVALLETIKNQEERIKAIEERLGTRDEETKTNSRRIRRRRKKDHRRAHSPKPVPPSEEDL